MVGLSMREPGLTVGNRAAVLRTYRRQIIIPVVQTGVQTLDMSELSYLQDCLVFGVFNSQKVLGYNPDVCCPPVCAGSLPGQQKGYAMWSDSC